MLFLDLLILRKYVYNCIVYFNRELTDNMYHVGGDPHMSKGCRAYGEKLSSGMMQLWPLQYSVYPHPLPAVWTCRVYSFPPPAVWMCRVYPLPLLAGMDVQGVSQSFACNVDVQGVFIYMFFIMPECRTVQHLVSPVPECTKMLTLEPVWYHP